MSTRETPARKKKSTHTIPIAIGIILVGTVFLVVSALGAVFDFQELVDSGHLVTAPAMVSVELEPGLECAVYHCLEGSHVTLNRPIVELPDDLQIDLIDPQTGNPIDNTIVDWVFRYSIFGRHDERHAIRTFKVPESGLVEFNVAGIEGDQVFAIGPTNAVFQTRALPRAITEITISMIVILFGFILIIKRLASTTLDLDLQNPR